jgi:FMN phosphatase YigB (HAD superfamily)
MNVVCDMIGLSQEGMQYTSLLHHATSKDEGIAKTHPEILFDCSELLRVEAQQISRDESIQVVNAVFVGDSMNRNVIVTK